jgi:hypothetical protein
VPLSLSSMPYRGLRILKHIVFAVFIASSVKLFLSSSPLSSLTQWMRSGNLFKALNLNLYSNLKSPSTARTFNLASASTSTYAASISTTSNMTTKRTPVYFLSHGGVSHPSPHPFFYFSSHSILSHPHSPTIPLPFCLIPPYTKPRHLPLALADR